MEFKPLYDRVLLKPLGTTENASGVYVPQSTTDRCNRMRVVAMGTDCLPIFSVGDNVLVHRYAGTEVDIGDEKFFIVKQCDALAIFLSS